MADRYPELTGVAWSGEIHIEIFNRLREERGEGWWLKDPSAYREWHPET
jgi:hypothetical protein